MRCKSALKSGAIGLVGLSALATTAWAQVGGQGAPWRGAGPQPCFGSDGGANKCLPPAETIAIRAGQLFDSKAGQMRAKQVIVLQGNKITDVGGEDQVKIRPARR